MQRTQVSYQTIKAKSYLKMIDNRHIVSVSKGVEEFELIPSSDLPPYLIGDSLRLK